jgi:type II secretory pathway component PulK
MPNRLMNERASTAGRISSRREPQGVALVTVIVAMAIALTLFAIWGRSVVQQHRRAAARQHQLQAARLAEAGIRRAVALRAANPQYNEETWTIPREAFGGGHSAEVRIRVMPAEANSTRFEATAEYPSGTPHRARASRHIEITATPTGTES